MSEFGKYWICMDCATQRGGETFKSGNTVVMSECAWCKLPVDQMLTPLRDFKWPDGRWPNKEEHNENSAIQMDPTTS